jgi:phosphate uptake regulator
MGDRVGNICEKVIYMVTGEYLAESEIPMFKVV